MPLRLQLPLRLRLGKRRAEMLYFELVRKLRE
jgi:hypothetical protein